ncbi:hypothetical protein IQ266_05145 [filamentous cyanobacterium LEGE 11480]|uniref:Uncharacterized protein n=1 Tax=Romeriopsis navalis LEGE 11480 TaxID=2777977 RepID=A0A928Z2K4_9CYAN|nr:hypothetical protein [Romeriopsis navalis]MBE9029147.1 hypothetical protein [Romeriopsis navalis LEGE 11480]
MNFVRSPRKILLGASSGLRAFSLRAVITIANGRVDRHNLQRHTVK